MIEPQSIESIYSEELYSIPTRPVIVLTKAWNDLSDGERDQLQKITTALRQRIHPLLGLDSLSIISVLSLDLSKWKQRPKTILYFGPPVKGLNYYEVIEASNTRMVLSESLAELIPNETARGRLWQALKMLFSS